MERHTELSDEEFEYQFKTCSLNPTLFNHEAHLRLAWIHIRKYGLNNALENIQMQLQEFVKHAGAIDKYHKTLTIAAIQAVNHFVKTSKSNEFQEFIKEYPQLKYGFKELIESHYSTDLFNSIKAKSEFIEPDLLAF